MLFFFFFFFSCRDNLLVVKMVKNWYLWLIILVSWSVLMLDKFGIFDKWWSWCKITSNLIVSPTGAVCSPEAWYSTLKQSTSHQSSWHASSRGWAGGVHPPWGWLGLGSCGGCPHLHRLLLRLPQIHHRFLQGDRGRLRCHAQSGVLDLLHYAGCHVWSRWVCGLHQTTLCVSSSCLKRLTF